MGKSLVVLCIGMTAVLGLRMNEKDPNINLARDTDNVEFDGGEGLQNYDCIKQGPMPTKCGPQDKWSMSELQASLKEFSEVWKAHPIGGKLGINHMFNEWFTVKQIKPSAIIESGVLYGHATWHLREAAGPNTPIFSLDPNDKMLRGTYQGVTCFKDPNPNTKYFAGANWTDIVAMDWDSLIPRESRANTLVVLDDHQIFLDRFKEIKDLGFGYIFYEDNYGYMDGNSDCASPNMFCNDLDASVEQVRYNSPYGDHTGDKSQAGIRHGSKGTGRENVKTAEHSVPRAEHDKNAEWIRANIEEYFEFPAIYEHCKSRPMMVEKPAELLKYGLPDAFVHKTVGGKKKSGFIYETVFAPYIKIKQS